MFFNGFECILAKLNVFLLNFNDFYDLESRWEGQFKCQFRGQRHPQWYGSWPSLFFIWCDSILIWFYMIFMWLYMVYMRSHLLFFSGCRDFAASAICYLLFAMCCLLFAVCYLLFAICYGDLLFAIRCYSIQAGWKCRRGQQTGLIRMQCFLIFHMVLW